MIKRIGDIVLISLSDMDSNIYVIGDMVIDSGTGFNFTRLRDIFRVLKREMKDVKQVVNTHGHFDHIGGNGYFLNAKVAIHEADAPILENGDREMSTAEFFDGQLNPRKPDRILKDGDRLNPDRMELEVLHTPGHTPGSICLYDRKKKLLFTGDTVFSNGVGRTDTPGGDPALLEKSLGRIMNLDVETILPGHGEPVLKGAKKVLDNIARGRIEERPEYEV
jgi:hydroxyacylglutathione hydrolase